MVSKDYQLTLNAENEICVSGDIDLTNVLPIYTQITDLINRVDVVRVNLKGVQYADSSSLAMLLECIRCAKRQGKNIAFYSMPQLLLNLGRVYGLDTVLPINQSLPFNN